MVCEVQTSTNSLQVGEAAAFSNEGCEVRKYKMQGLNRSSLYRAVYPDTHYRLSLYHCRAGRRGGRSIPSARSRARLPTPTTWSVALTPNIQCAGWLPS